MQIQKRIVPQAAPPSLDPKNIAFGKIVTPHFFCCEYRDGAWRDARIEPVHNFSLHPAALVFHYAQAIFEGLKAYQHDDGGIALFRPEMNARRFNASASRMSMPHVDEQLFLDAVQELVKADHAYTPPFPGSLYVRPTMIGVEPCIGVKSSSEFIFFILTLPAGSYFPELPSGAGAVDVLISESVVRAAPGGTGHVKAAANYAVTLQVITQAKEVGCAQVLFLDSAPQRHVEEMGGMNILFVDGGELVTPPLGGTILNGVTRDSILTLARDMGLTVREHAYAFDDMMERIRSGRITEVMACGTAAVITGIRGFKLENGARIPVGDAAPGPVTSKLFEQLQGIQYGRVPDRHNWVTQVVPAGAAVR
ncbi:MAG: branched-chain amino acid aminotransferase [Bryobacterales bacterium]|nr:branched-chain amino acid aminotransferase [Bryobacterales bacterium]